MDAVSRLRITRWLSSMNIQVDWQEGLQSVMSYVGEFVTLIINRTSTGVIGVVTTVLVTLFTLFYFFRDGRSMITQMLYLSPLRREYEERVLSHFVLISRATFKGTVVIGFIQGVLGALTLLVFGVPTWAVWGVVMLILGVLPLLGPGLVLIPAAVIMLISGQIWQGIAVAFISIVLIGAVDNLLRPRLVGHGAKMHDLLIFFSTLGGISVFGFLGFIIGPVIAAFFSSLLTIYGMEFRDTLRQDRPDVELAKARRPRKARRKD
jgi:predicted PurR-regulated permease PerM